MTLHRCCIDVDATLYKRHVLAGKRPNILPNKEHNMSMLKNNYLNFTVMVSTFSKAVYIMFTSLCDIYSHVFPQYIVKKGGSMGLQYEYKADFHIFRMLKPTFQYIAYFIATLFYCINVSYPIYA